VVLTTEDTPLEEAIARHGKAWEDIVVKQALNPSLLPGWIHCVTEAFCLTSQCNVFILSEEGSPIGFLPYYTKKVPVNGVKVNTVNITGNIVSYHQELITDQSELLLNYFLNHLSKNSSWDQIAITNLVKDGPSYQTLTRQKKYPFTIYAGESSPYLELTKNWDTLLATKSQKFRYKVRKRERQLRDSQDMSVNWYTDNTNVDELFEYILRIESNSWKKTAKIDIGERPSETRYYQSLLPFMANNKLLFANVLKFGETPIAYNLCYCKDGVLGQLKTSFDENYKELKPGLIVVEDALIKSITIGASEFDFLGDIMEHKLAWTNAFRPHFGITIYNRSILGIYLLACKRVRQALRSFISGISRS
jgi:CelD/BcsL family acetyltransferase involved in cellulose biosynthesis